jgi:chaperonin cofactor prefoldin
MSFLERAKMAYIEREDGEIDSELLLLKTKIENISRQLERQGEHLDDRIERITRSMAATMKREIANTGKTLDATQVGSP